MSIITLYIKSFAEPMQAAQCFVTFIRIQFALLKSLCLAEFP